MTELRTGDVAAFRTYDRQVIVGKVIGEMSGVYLVMSLNFKHCSMYSDGLYRFRDQNIVRPEK